MPAPSWEDLGEFLDADEFGVRAVVTLQAGGSIDLVGIYDDPYLNAELGEYDLDTTHPRFTCRASDVSGVRRGDTLTIDGLAMDILSAPQPDGTGMAMLDLAPLTS